MTMYIKNKRNSNKIKDFGTYQALFLIKVHCFEALYFSRNNGYQNSSKETASDLNNKDSQ